ncbi:MAG: hypothetical protein QOH09_4028 [Pseudonocardiales bacterium]|jgi:hypothetical protein|nr:hypothetical protein [Pseudonocardiales bacterium]
MVWATWRGQKRRQCPQSGRDRWSARPGVAGGPAVCHESACQRRIVAGVTRRPIRRWRGSRRTSAAIIARSAQDIRGLRVWRRSTASWWRRTTISTSLSAVDRVSRTIQPMSRVRIRYVSRSAISRIMPGRGPRRTCRSRKWAEFGAPARPRNPEGTCHPTMTSTRSSDRQICPGDDALATRARH